MSHKIALTLLLTGISCNALAMQSLFEALAPAVEVVGTHIKEQFAERFKESPLVVSLREILQLANRETLPAAEVAKIHALIARGLNVNATTNFGASCLHMACAFRDPVLARMIIEAGAYVDYRIPESKMLTASGYLVSYLPANYRNVSDRMLTGLQAQIGFTPLHVAACFGNVEVIKLLLSKGSEVNAVGQDARRPIFPVHCAVAGGHYDAFVLLMKQGAYDLYDARRNEFLAIAYQQAYREALKLDSISAVTRLTLPLDEFAQWIRKSRWFPLILALVSQHILEGKSFTADDIEAIILKNERIPYDFFAGRPDRHAVNANIATFNPPSL